MQQTDTSDVPQLAERLLSTVQAIAVELQPGLAGSRPISLDSQLDRDLGLDSLGRLELITRLEREYAVRLPEQVLQEADTPRQLLRALLGAEARVETTQLKVELRSDAHLPAPAQAQTLMEVLDWHAERQPDYPHIRLFESGSADEPRIITYRELQQQAQRIAIDLQQRGLARGATVALMLPTGADYFYSFFGVLYAGGIPVPIYPPARPAQLADHMQRQAGILENAQCRFLITVPEARLLARLLMSQLGELQDVLVPERMRTRGVYTQPRVDAEDIAFLQYTSGSTGNPKGVVLSHRNLLSNIRVDGAAIEADSSDVFVSWLPLYHDMGLIGAWLGSLYFAAQLIITSPLHFLARPVRWLQLLHRYGGTLSAAPNFAYQLCLSRIDEAELQGLDLSHWRIAMNGAEAVSPDTVEQFCERFAAYGFRRESMFPVYGLAECSVGLAFPALHEAPRIDRIQREALARHGEAIPAADDDETALRFVGCGHALAQHTLRIVDDAGQELPERRQGRLQFRGPSATRGYFRNPQATQRLFDGDWLESGDLAYRADGELYFTGRSKDMIIRGGRNIYPHELEEAVSGIHGIRKGRVAVFASTDAQHQTETLVVLAETRSQNSQEHARLRQEINAIASDLTLLPADDVVLAPPGSVLKTSSGKIRRAACRELYERQAIGQARQSVWGQLLLMEWRALPEQARRMRHRLGALLYAMYATALFYLLAGWVTLCVLLLPGAAWRWAQLGRTARLLARLCGTSLQLTGEANLPPREQACIYVLNHASYIDSYAVAALLPRRFRFVAKAELRQAWLPRTFLQRIGTLFVERHKHREGIAAMQQATEAARAGDSLLFYPEGTFTRAPGLRPFRLGAFMAAAGSGLPVVPLAMQGTRNILPANSRMPRHGDIRLHVCPALHPSQLRRQQDSDWDLAIRLKSAAREAILAHCGEPDMQHEQAFAPRPEERPRESRG